MKHKNRRTKKKKVKERLEIKHKFREKKYEWKIRKIPKKRKMNKKREFQKKRKE